MAQMIGDGPNRGRSAPPPKVRKLPKQQDDGPRAERPRSQWKPDFRGPAERLFSQAPRERAPRPYVELPRKPERPPALAPRSKAAVQLYNQAQTQADERTAQNTRIAGMYDAMAQRQQRAEARAEREAKDRTETDRVLTAEEWVKLSPRQQAAVQANADLAAAIALDIKTQGKHKNRGDEGSARVREYMSKVTDLFGEDGSVGYKGIEFAPNTVAFLEQRGLGKEDLGGKTLDDLVSGDTLFTMDQIQRLGRPAEKDATFKVKSGDDLFLERLAAGQQQYQEDLAKKLARGNELLSGITQDRTNRAAGERYGAVQAAAPRYPDIQPQTMQMIDLYMEGLARSDSPIDQALTAINLDLQQRGASPAETEQVFKAMQERSLLGSTGEGKWFDGVDFPMRSPTEVAQVLGTPTLKRMSEPR